MKKEEYVGPEIKVISIDCISPLAGSYINIGIEDNDDYGDYDGVFHMPKQQNIWDD